MHSGYGVSEMQQFAVDGICASPFFSSSSSPPSPPLPPLDVSRPQKHHHHSIHPQPLSFFQQQQEEYHPRQLQFQEQHSATPPLQQQMQPRFPPHFHHPVPITHQLFHQTSHQFQRFQQERSLHDNQTQHQHQLGLDNGDSRPTQNSASPPSVGIDIGNRIGLGGAGTASAGSGGGISSFLGLSMSFRLSVNENAGGSRDELNNDDAILHGVEVDGFETRWPLPSTSRGVVDSSIKEPFWRPLDLEMECINRNSQRCKGIHQGKQQRQEQQEKEQEQNQEQENLEIETSGGSKQFKEMKEVTNGDADSGANTGSNYKLFSELEAICKSRTTATLMGNNNNNQTGSSSALTGENLQTTVGDPNLMDDANPNNHMALTSEDASTGDDTSLQQMTAGNGSKRVGDEGSKKRKRRRKERKKQLRSIAVFIESLVKQLIDHQEALHRKFLEVLEKREVARMAVEETRRHQDADKSRRQLKARGEQRAISEAREATIVSFLEKMTGESINFPTERFQSQGEVGEGEDNEMSNENNESSSRLHSNRWPKAEVQDLIRVRSGLESRFQEPGLKGPLWEEVSTVMSSMGYRRNSKRCKEKWDNINKYFKKTKESTKKRSKHSNTCPYFHQLDQLYSKNKINANNDRPGSNVDVEQRCHSELLYAVVASKDQPTAFNYSDLSPVAVGMVEFAASNNYIINTIGDDLIAAAPTEMADEDDDGHDNVDGDDEQRFEKEGPRENKSQRHPQVGLFSG